MFPILPIIALLAGLGVSGAGLVMQSDANERANKLSIASEKAKENAIRLDAQRKRREIIRQGIMARAQALAAGTASGAQHGSGLPGALGMAANQTGFNIAGINQSEQNASEQFRFQRQISEAKGDMAMGQGLTALGGNITNSLGSIQKLSGLI